MWLTIAHFFFAGTTGFGTLLCRRRRGGGGAQVQLAGATATPAAPTAASTTGTTCAHLLEAQWRRGAQTLYDMAVPFELLIFILYWALLYTDGTDTTANEWFRDLTNHLIAFVLIWVDLLLSANRFPDRHVLIALAGAVIYLFINLGYSDTHSPVYKVLKWDGAYSAILSIGSLIAICVFYFLASLLAWALDSCALRCCRTRAGAAAKVPLSSRSSVSPASPHAAHVEGARCATDPFPAAYADECRAFPCSTCCCACCAARVAAGERAYGVASASPAASGHDKDIALAPLPNTNTAVGVAAVGAPVSYGSGDGTKGVTYV